MTERGEKDDKQGNSYGGRMDISDSDICGLSDGVPAESADDKRRTGKNTFGISGIEPDTW